jgi:Peptidase S24-like
MGISPDPPLNARFSERTLVPYASNDELLAIARGNLMPEQIEARWPCGLRDCKDIIALNGLDASMEPKIPADAMLMVRYGQVPSPGEIALVALLRGNELLLRRLAVGPTGRPGDLPFLLKSDNPDFGGYRTIEKRDQPVVLGKLAGVSIELSR